MSMFVKILDALLALLLFLVFGFLLWGAMTVHCTDALFPWDKGVPLRDAPAQCAYR